MPFNGAKVEKMARAHRLKAKEFKALVFPERSGHFSWDQIRVSKNPSAKTIEAIADLLECSIDELFDRPVAYPSNNVSGDNNTVGSHITISSDPNVLTATIAHLNDVIARQDKTIEEQNRRIDQLIELARR